MKKTKGVLSGVKVLDLTRVLAGPYCCMMLADMGAEVIKIEVPVRGDDSRRYPPFIKDTSGRYLNLNRNKRGITLNLKSEEGKKIFLKLVKNCDIVVENFRPGVMERLGLGYSELKKVNPAIVYGAISGFGQYGPYSYRPGYDLIAQAMSGMMSVTGWPESDPARAGTAVADIMAGFSCAVGVLAAYINRLKTGVGDMVDIALIDTMVSAMEVLNMIYLVDGRVPGRIGDRYETIYPTDSFHAKDGMVVIACGNNKLYGLLSDVIGNPDMKEPRFKENWDRVEHHAELRNIIESWTKERTVEEIRRIMSNVGIPTAPIYNIGQVMNDPNIAKERNMVIEQNYERLGKVRILGSQYKFTNNKITEYALAPEVGQDTAEVLKEEIGLTKEEYEALKKKGVF